MLKTYKFRLYPTKPQEEKLLWTLEHCRLVYNYLLEAFQQYKWSHTDSAHVILKLKEQNPEFNNIYSKTLQYENDKLFANLHALRCLKKESKKVGKLRFKAQHSFKTFIYNQSGFKIIPTELHYDKLHLSKIGDIPFIMHRNIEGTIKQITIKHSPSGRWFASIVAETRTTPLPSTNTKRVGIDLGVMSYVHDSDNHKINHAKHLGKSLERLKRAQRILSRKKKGSKNRNEQKIKVARIHEKIVNQRDDFMHKLSRYYINNHGFIAVEDLNIKGLIRKSYNARNIRDASWSRFVQMLCFKAESAGCTVVKVEPRGTTQECSSCGTIVPKRLWDRMHSCACGFHADRDYNAALNILKRALGQELSEFTPVEIGPLLNEQVRSVKQDAQPFRAGSSQGFLSGTHSKSWLNLL